MTLTSLLPLFATNAREPSGRIAMDCGWRPTVMLASVASEAMSIAVTLLVAGLVTYARCWSGVIATPRIPGLAVSESIGPPGEGAGARTWKGRGLLVVPPTWTVTGPLVAASGTAKASVVSVAATTGAGAPFTLTAFWEGAALNPVPVMTTLAPRGAAGGLNEEIVTGGGSWTAKPTVVGAASICPSRSKAPAVIERRQFAP